MSELIFSWLNDEIQLSKKMSSFEEDFANGYFIGELLAKFNQQLNFQQFINKDTREAKIKNFDLLKPTLRTLKVKFNSNTVENIIKKKEGVAKSLMYQIKSALEKVNNPADILFMNKNGKFNATVPLKKLENPREKYDKMDDEFFRYQLNRKNPRQNQVDLEKHLEKFDFFHKKQQMKIHDMKEKEMEEDSRLKNELRKIQINKLQRTISFTEDWTKKIEETWEKNMLKRKETELKEMQFKGVIQDKKISRLKKIQEQARMDFNDNIEKFEDNLNKQEIEKKPGLDKNNFSASATMMRLKEKKLLSDFLRKERDKRRRKMIVDQVKAQREFEVVKREEILLGKIAQQSKQEMELDYEIWRSQKCKDIIIENREFREDRYRQKREVIVLNSKYKEEEMLSILQDEFANDLAMNRRKRNEIKISNMQISRKENYNFCSGLIDFFVELSNQCYDQMQISNSNSLDLLTIENGLKQFISLDNSENSKSIENGDFSSNNDIQQRVFELELEDYIKGKGIWKFTPKLKDVGVTEDTNEIQSPSSPINNLFFSDVLEQIYDLIYEENESSLGNELEDQCALKILLLGAPFSGKSSVSKFLNEKFGMLKINFNEIILEIAKIGSIEVKHFLESKFQNGEDLDAKEKAKVLSEFIFKKFPKVNSQELFEKFLSFSEPEQVDFKYDSDSPPTNEEIFQHELRSLHHKWHDGWVLLDFPMAVEEAVALEHQLTNFQAEDQKPLSQKEVKIKEASKILVFREKPKALKEFRESGINLVFSLEVDHDVALKRAIGRRIDPLTGLKYHLDTALPALDNAPLIERLIPVTNKTDFDSILVQQQIYHESNLESLKNWYCNFGFNGDCVFHTIDGNLNIEDVLVKINSITENFLTKRQEGLERRIKEIDEEKNLQDEKELEKRELENLPIKSPTSEEISASLENTKKNSINLQNISKEYLKMISENWDGFLSQYLTRFKKSMGELKIQRSRIPKQIHNYLQKAIYLLQIPDNRDNFVIEYQKGYNKFLDEQIDMIEDVKTKEEFHQRIDDLSDQIFSMITIKKERNLEEKKQVLSSGTIEREMELFLSNIMNLLESEIHLYFGISQILKEFYGLVDGQIVEEEEEPTFAFSDLTQIEIENHEKGFPRLEKIIEESLKVLNPEEAEVGKGAAGGSKPGAKKDDKKAAAPKKEVPKEETMEELSPLKKELKQALNEAKANLKYRIDSFKQFSISNLSQMREKANKFYKDFEELIEFSYKVEVDSLNELGKILGKYIENNAKIQNEIHLNYITVEENHMYLNFYTPIPVLLPAREPMKKNRFTISGLYKFVEELKSVANSDFKVDTKTFIDILQKKIKSKEVPETWFTFGLADLFKLCKNLDPKKQGYIRGKVFSTLICLLEARIPSEKEKDKYAEELGIDFLERSEFANIPAFFDSQVRTDNEDGSKGFPREKRIKELLFYINKEKGDNETLNPENLLKCMDCSKIFNKTDSKLGERYGDILFA